jgi:hypothetical protein
VSLRFLADENIDQDLVLGLKRRICEIDIVRVQDVGLRTLDDPTILQWAAEEGRLLISRDIKTIPTFAYERVAAGLAMPGVLVRPPAVSMAVAIRDLSVIAGATQGHEWPTASSISRSAEKVGGKGRFGFEDFIDPASRRPSTFVACFDGVDLRRQVDAVVEYSRPPSPRTRIDTVTTGPFPAISPAHSADPRRRAGIATANSTPPGRSNRDQCGEVAR